MFLNLSKFEVHKIPNCSNLQKHAQEMENYPRVDGTSGGGRVREGGRQMLVLSATLVHRFLMIPAHIYRVFHVNSSSRKVE